MTSVRKYILSRLALGDAQKSASERLLPVILKLILVAAITTMPLYVFGEEFSLAHLWRVLAINGGTACGCLALLRLVKAGWVGLVSALLVWGLFGLNSILAATNGEPIHTNVVNFVLVLVIANLLMDRRDVVLVAVACALTMIGIAYRQSLVIQGAEQNERLVETVVQFLPQFIMIALLLRILARTALRSRLARNDPTRQTS